MERLEGLWRRQSGYFISVFGDTKQYDFSRVIPQRDTNGIAKSTVRILLELMAFRFDENNVMSLLCVFR